MSGGSEVDRTEQYEGSDSDREDNELAPVTQKDNLSLATLDIWKTYGGGVMEGISKMIRSKRCAQKRDDSMTAEQQKPDSEQPNPCNDTEVNSFFMLCTRVFFCLY